MYRRTRRYPEITPNMTMEEVSRRWSELIRELNNRDVEPIPPGDIYGRNITVGGEEQQNIAFVTAGTSLPIAPTPAYWNIYEYQIPRDAGLILVQPVSVSANANVQIQTFLPLARSVEGRTITITYDNTTDISGLTLFNLAVFPTSGSGDYIVPVVGRNISVETSSVIQGSLAVSAAFIDISGNRPAPGRYLMAYNQPGGALYTNIPVSVSGSTAVIEGSPITTGIFSQITGNLDVSTYSQASYGAPLNYTFRAYYDKWVQIA